MKNWETLWYNGQSCLLQYVGMNPFLANFPILTFVFQVFLEG